MRKLTLTLTAAALALGGATVAMADQQIGKRGADADGDGVITLAEHNARAAKMFERMDVNSDGFINDADSEARKAERFAKLDTDKSGSIEVGEFKFVMGILGEDWSPEELDKMIKAVDTNNDGHISEEEFTTMMKSKKGGS